MRRILASMAALGMILLVLTGQRPHEEEMTQEEIIELGVRIKVEEFRKMQWRKCRERAVLAAETAVDSMIRAMARYEPIKPVDKPPRTDKPQRPELQLLPDSISDALKKKKDE